MNALFKFVFTASGPIVVFLVVAVWVFLRPASAFVRRCALTAAACYWLAGAHVVATGANRLLTVGYHQFRAGDAGVGPTAVVVLGSGDDFIDGWSDQLTLTTPIEGARVLEAARVFRLISPAWIISSGGPSDQQNPAHATGLTMRDELVRLGVPKERIIVEASARTTRAEALLIAPMVRALGVQHVVIVTSDTHMRRSLGTFRAVGVNGVPAIAPEPRQPDGWSEWILPAPNALKRNGEALHEIGGIPYYWLRGWWSFRALM